jgi:CubicO group peptidase (beta-lactamase class C family)
MRYLFILFLLPLSLFAQSTHQLSGIWSGAIQLPGAELKVIVQLQHAGQWSGTMDIPQQGAKGLSLTQITLNEDNFSFSLPEVPGNAGFLGQVSPDFNAITGNFNQGGLSFPLQLIRQSSAQQTAAALALDASINTFRHLADSLRLRTKVPGLAVGIIKDGELILAEGFGLADVDAKTPVSSQTLFPIGSCTKAFTATGLAILQHQGRLAWDKPVRHYLPDFTLWDKFATQEMTPTDLLTHQSGLPRHDLFWYGSPFSRRELMQRLQYLQPSKSFRSTWQYQNLMYLSAGVLTEQLSGQSWESFTQQNIFTPLGMRTSCFSHKDAPIGSSLALPYRKSDNDSIRLIPYRDIDAIGPAGSIVSNIDDMLQWVKFHLNKGNIGDTEILPAATVHQLHTPVKLIDNSTNPLFPEFSHRSYAYGWFVYHYGEHLVVQHGGNIDGFSALVFLLPEHQIGMVFLTNLNGNPLPGILANYATDMLLQRNYTDWFARTISSTTTPESSRESPQPIPGTQPSRPLQQYAGQYEHPAYGITTITLANHQLHFSFNSFEGIMKHWHYDVFQASITDPAQEMMLSFHTHKDGSIEKLGIALEPALAEDIFFTRLPPDVLQDADYIHTLTGMYTLDNMVITISYQQGKLTALVPGQPSYELQPYKTNFFRLQGLNGYSLEFVFEKNQPNAAQIKFHQPNGIFPAKRKP